MVFILSLEMRDMSTLGHGMDQCGNGACLALAQLGGGTPVPPRCHVAVRGAEHLFQAAFVGAALLARFVFVETRIRDVCIQVESGSELWSECLVKVRCGTPPSNNQPGPWC